MAFAPEMLVKKGNHQRPSPRVNMMLCEVQNRTRTEMCLGCHAPSIQIRNTVKFVKLNTRAYHPQGRSVANSGQKMRNTRAKSYAFNDHENLTFSNPLIRLVGREGSEPSTCGLWCRLGNGTYRSHPQRIETVEILYCSLVETNSICINQATFFWQPYGTQSDWSSCVHRWRLDLIAAFQTSLIECVSFDLCALEADVSCCRHRV
jgi:hypothetical protein